MQQEQAIVAQLRKQELLDAQQRASTAERELAVTRAEAEDATQKLGEQASKTRAGALEKERRQNEQATQRNHQLESELSTAKMDLGLQLNDLHAAQQAQANLERVLRQFQKEREKEVS